MQWAHLSDLHFFCPKKHIRPYLSKRIVGLCNALWHRGNQHNAALTERVVEHLSQLHITHVLLTGDLTTISLPDEFLCARKFCNTLQDAGMQIYLLPGNHDKYTHRSARNKEFFAALSPIVDFQGDVMSFSLPIHGVAAYRLHHPWWLVLVDCAIATPFYSSNGRFEHAVEHNLRRLLHEIPQDAKILLANHFPIGSEGFPFRHLHRNTHLQSILEQDPRINLFVHGHRHTSTITEHPSFVSADSGSLSHYKKSSFHRILLHNDGSFAIYPFAYNKNATCWENLKSKNYYSK